MKMLRNMVAKVRKKSRPTKSDDIFHIKEHYCFFTSESTSPAKVKPNMAVM